MINYVTQKIFFDNSEFTLTGYSRSGVRTGIYIKEYNIMLDAGVYFDQQPKLILVTHGHLDHINSLYSSLLDNKEKPTVMVPPSSEHHIRNYMNAQHSVSLNKKTFFNKFKLVSLVREYHINLSKKFKIIPYVMDHRIDTIGYGIVIIDKMLNPEYKEKTVDELIQIKKEGKSVDIINEKGVILFCGDTSSMVLNELPFNLYKFVIIECTFLYNEHYIEAVDRKHLHYLELKSFFETNLETNFILIHFSKRYSDNNIREFFATNSHPNVSIFI